MSLPAGTRLGPYEIIGAIGAGGTGEVYRADGNALAFFDQVPEGGVTRGLFVVRRDGSGTWGPPVSLRKGISSTGSWLDAHSLAYARDGALEIVAADSGSIRVAYTPSPGSADPRVESVVTSEDGRTLYFKNHDAEGRASFWAVPAAGGRPRLLVRFTDPSRVSTRRDFAAGAGQLFFTIEDRQADIWMADITRR
jgi:hypothetical protein